METFGISIGKFKFPNYPNQLLVLQRAFAHIDTLSVLQNFLFLQDNASFPNVKNYKINLNNYCFTNGANV
jgi:CO dehydrogenase/acetyl-CoA synthase epsilon subunit